MSGEKRKGACATAMEGLEILSLNLTRVRGLTPVSLADLGLASLKYIESKIRHLGQKSQPKIPRKANWEDYGKISALTGATRA